MRDLVSELAVGGNYASIPKVHEDDDRLPIKTKDRYVEVHGSFDPELPDFMKRRYFMKWR